MQNIMTTLADKWMLFCGLYLMINSLQGQSVLDLIDIPNVHQQVILVTTRNATQKEGVLSLYQRERGLWQSIQQSMTVTVGKNGLAGGRGLHQNVMDSIQKIEGDGKAPAGIFRLGTSFGYVKTVVLMKNYPYRQVTDRDYFVDDSNSPDYNQWVVLSEDNNPEDRWKSYEHMRREDHLYQWGLVVEHNQNPVENGMGSAIFLHVWRQPRAPTLGCTAMAKEDILKIINWLDPAQQPLLIQVVDQELSSLKFKNENLPKIHKEK